MKEDFEKTLSDYKKEQDQLDDHRSKVKDSIEMLEWQSFVLSLEEEGFKLEKSESQGDKLVDSYFNSENDLHLDIEYEAKDDKAFPKSFSIRSGDKLLKYHNLRAIPMEKEAQSGAVLEGRGRPAEIIMQEINTFILKNKEENKYTN